MSESELISGVETSKFLFVKLFVNRSVHINLKLFKFVKEDMSGDNEVNVHCPDAVEEE